MPMFPPEFTALPTFKDRETALAILPQAPPSWRSDQALATTLRQWQQESPQAALAWLQALPAGEWRDRAAAVLDEPAAHAKVTALKLQEITLQYHPDRSEVTLEEVKRITGQSARSDLAGTLAALTDWPPGPARQSALAEAAKVAASQNTAAALTRIQQIADPAAQADGIRGVLAVWTEHEPLAASEWLPTLAAGPVREAAVDTFAEKIASLDPAASLAWAATLIDPTARIARLKTTYQEWYRSKPSLASAALAELPGLSPADLQQVRRPARPATPTPK